MEESRSGSEDDEDCGAVEAVVVRGCLTGQESELKRLFESRLFGHRREFLDAMGLGEDGEVANAVCEVLDSLDAGDWGAVLVKYGTAWTKWRDLGAQRKQERHWRAVHAIGSLLGAHFESLRGRWERATELLEPLLQDAAWRDLASSALAISPANRARPVTTVWPSRPPLEIPFAFRKFPAVREISPPPSFEEYRGLCETREPFIIKGLAADWPALVRWRDPGHLRQIIGHRMLPIELGSSYMSSDFEQRLMPFSQYLEAVLSSTGTDAALIGYLAHTPLLDQAPKLSDDIPTPSLLQNCSYVERNIWFGPAGTVSPLHTDPKDNIFVQVVGSKCVLLHPPSDNPCLYPHAEFSNTSLVAADNVDAGRFPLYSQAKGSVAIVQAGDALWIPKGWWHYVKSLEPSWSVSFWS